MNPVRSICENCKAIVMKDRELGPTIIWELCRRMDEGRCIFGKDGSFWFMPSDEDDELPRGVVPDFCQYTAELAVSQT